MGASEPVSGHCFRCVMNCYSFFYLPRVISGRGPGESMSGSPSRACPGWQGRHFTAQSGVSPGATQGRRDARFMVFNQVAHHAHFIKSAATPEIFTLYLHDALPI